MRAGTLAVCVASSNLLISRSHHVDHIAAQQKVAEACRTSEQQDTDQVKCVATGSPGRAPKQALGGACCLSGAQRVP